MAECPAAVLAKLMREESETLLKVLAENVEALVGHSVEIQPLDPEGEELASIFGEAEVYVFPVEDHQSGPLPSMLLLDLTGAVHAGAAFSLMGAEQVKEILETREIPEILHDSIGEVANILCGAAVNVLREKMPKAPEFRRGADFETTTTPPWPGILARVDDSHPWDLIAGRIMIAGEPKGALLLASSDRVQGIVSPEQILAATGGQPARPEAEQGKAPATDETGAAGAPAEAAPSAEPEPAAGALDAAPVAEEPKPAAAAPPATAAGDDAQGAAGGATLSVPEGVRVLLAAHPADMGAFGLRTLLEESGITVHRARARCCEGEILFVVSRSPTDLLVRLKSLAAPPLRPSLVVACSDRPTRDLVVAARNGHADSFLVLPTTREKLAALLAQIPQPAEVS
ncbi:MAG TPA: hypothetical protein ENK10_00280 [Acidobacteria bacterium]|nr:hypothetical protein [Acidobacteriota bacterium]